MMMHRGTHLATAVLALLATALPAAAQSGAPAKKPNILVIFGGGEVADLRYDQWKLVFMEQRAHGFDVRQEPLVTLRVPKLFNLRADPFERADREGMGYQRRRIDRVFLLAPAQVYVANRLQSFKEFPPRQKPGSFNLQSVMDSLQSSAGGMR